MLSSALSLPLLALLSTVLASPINPPSRSFSIPISKRSGAFLREKRSVDEHVAMLEASVRSAYIKYGMRDGVVRRSGQVLLGDVTGDIQYFGSLSIGTPPYQYQVILDTGSSDLLIATAPCDAGCDPTTPIYHPSLSSTSGVSTTPFTIVYGTGMAQGAMVKDTVSFAGYTLKEQIFAACDNLTNIIDGELSGLLGLGWQSLATSGATPFVQALWEKGMLEAPVFGFAFARWNGVAEAQGLIMPGGVMTVGAVNSTFFDGNLNWIPLTKESYWLIPMDDVSVGGTSLGMSAASVTIDTGTSLIGAPIAAAEAIYAQIPGSQPYGEHFYAFPCQASVDIAFTFGKVSYRMESSDFNNGATDNTSSLCIGAVFVLSSSHGTGRWIFGDAFLKNVYSAYRFSPAAVGFAPISTVDSVLQNLGEVPRSNATLLDGTNFGSQTASAGGAGATSGSEGRRRGMSWMLGAVGMVGLMLG